MRLPTFNRPTPTYEELNMINRALQIELDKEQLFHCMRTDIDGVIVTDPDGGQWRTVYPFTLRGRLSKKAVGEKLKVLQDQGLYRPLGSDFGEVKI